MHHSIVYKRPGHYVIGPVPRLMPDGRLAVLVLVSPFADHYGLDKRFVLDSTIRAEAFKIATTLPFPSPGRPAMCADAMTALLM